MRTRVSILLPVAWAPALLVALVAIAAVLGLAISSWSPPSTLEETLPVVATVTLVVVGFTRPFGLLAFLLAIWAPTLFLIKDVPVAHFGEIELSLSQGFGLLVLFIYAGRLAIGQLSLDARIPMPWPMYFFALFVCVMALGLVLADDFRSALADFLRFSAGVAIVFAILTLPMSPLQFRRLYWGFVVGIGTAALVTLLMPVLNSDAETWNTFGVERAGGTLAGPGVTSALMVNGIAFLLPLMLAGRRTIKLITVFVAVLALMAIFVTVTRSAILGVPLLILVVTWIAPEIGISRRNIILGFVVLGVAYALTFMSVDDAIVSARLQDIPVIGHSSLGDDETGTGRMGLYRAQANAFADAPVLVKVFGHGLHSSFQISSDALGFHIMRGFVVQGPHNSYLWLLSELGLLGLATYGAFLVATGVFFRNTLLDHSARLRLGSTGIVFCTCFLAFFVTYHLTSEMFGWNIPTFSGRVYFLVFLAMALRCITEPPVLEGLESLMAPLKTPTEAISAELQTDIVHGRVNRTQIT